MGDELDERILMNFVEGEREDKLSASNTLDQLDGAWGIGSPKAKLQVPPTASDRPPTRSGNYRATFVGSEPAVVISGPGPLVSPMGRRLPDIALDLSPTSGRSPTGGSSGGIGGSVVSLPATSSSTSASPKKPFVMGSLAIGLNEVISTDDGCDGDAQAKIGGGSSGRSPKKYHLGLSQRSPTPASPKSSSPSTSGSPSPTSGGSKLVPIRCAGGGGSSRSLLKFDSIVNDAKGTDDTASARTDPPPNYRRTIASRSPLRDRSILNSGGDATNSSDLHIAPSKLDPLDAESTRCSTFTNSTVSTTTVASTLAAALERKSMRLPPNARLEKPQAAPDSKSAPSSPDKQTSSPPMFRNPFTRPPTAGSSRTRDEKKSRCDDDDDDDDHGTDLVPSHGSDPYASTPLDKLQYLSFSPRATGSSSPFSAGTGGKQQRDLPSLSLSSDAKESDAQLPRKVKTHKQQQQQQEVERTAAQVK